MSANFRKGKMLEKRKNKCKICNKNMRAKNKQIGDSDCCKRQADERKKV